MSMRRIIRRSLLLYAVSAIVLCAYCLLPWLQGIGLKFGPLREYRVYEVGKKFDGYPQPSLSGWRQPTSRWELLTTGHNDILFDHKTIEREARQYKHRPQIQRPPDPIPTTAGDNLDDFVIDFGDSFGYPASYEQLEHAIATGKADRSSTFFSSRWSHQKPFYGRIPTSLCYQDSGPDRDNFRISPFQIFKDFKLVDVQLPSPQTSQVWIVTAGGFTNARQAAYEKKQPVLFDREECWAVVFAMYTKNAPVASVIDRVDIGKTTTDILLYRPVSWTGRSEIKAYWFFVPLGRLAVGPYSVNVRIANDGSTLATTTAQLRTATNDEIAKRNSESLDLQQKRSIHHEEATVAQREHGAALQLHLDRLAAFLEANKRQTQEDALLSTDVARLGEAVDWNLNLYRVPNPDVYRLSPPNLGYKLDSTVARSEFDNTRATWKPSQIKPSEIWLCDGTDAGWFASSAYRNVPEFNGALTAKDPTPTQSKIRKIWKALEEKSKAPRTLLPWVNAKGSINDAIDTAYQVFVEDKPPTKSFTADDEIWAVFVSKRSFLIRDVYTRTYGDEFDKSKRTEFLIRASAYIAKADGVTNDACAPVTLALIPLGKSGPNGVGISTSLLSICCRDLNRSPPSLFDANPPKSILADLWNYMSHGTGFIISK